MPSPPSCLSRPVYLRPTRARFDAENDPWTERPPGWRAPGPTPHSGMPGFSCSQLVHMAEPGTWLAFGGTGRLGCAMTHGGMLGRAGWIALRRRLARRRRRFAWLRRGLGRGPGRRFPGICPGVAMLTVVHCLGSQRRAQSQDRGCEQRDEDFHAAVPSRGRTETICIIPACM